MDAKISSILFPPDTNKDGGLVAILFSNFMLKYIS